MTSYNPPHGNPWTRRQSRDVGASEPSRCAQATTDAYGIDEFGMAVAKPGEWLPNFDDAFDLEFDE